MSDTAVVLIDLSSIAHPIWHMSQSEPDPNRASQKIVERVRALVGSSPHAAICCDAGRSFRKDITATYKANRPEHEATLFHQIDLAKEQLAADGFPVWGVPGFEADDLIATAAVAAQNAGREVLIVSSDKDLLQLVAPGVTAMSAKDGARFDAAAVVAKFGVEPWQMRDYLMLVGDASDNVKGAVGIGPKKAADLLKTFGSLDTVYREMVEHATKFKPAIATALQEFRPRREEVQQLITLRIDVPIPFAEIDAPRVPKDQPAALTFDDLEEDDMDPMTTPAPAQPSAPAPVDPKPEATPAPPAVAVAAPPSTAIAVREPDVVLAAPADWERGLDPRSMREARVLAADMHQSRMFSAYGTPQGVLSTIMVGRELGLPAMASLRSIHNIEGRHALSAQLMVAIILRSGLADYFEPIAFDDEHAVYETHRKGARNPVRLTHTIEMARKAWTKTTDAWDKSGWGRVPTDMLVARATARLARMVYPDLITGLYTPEELREVLETSAAA